VFVVGLVGQRDSDFLEVQAAQLKHGARIDPQPGLLADNSNRGSVS
jgi:hypothetical protein